MIDKAWLTISRNDPHTPGDVNIVTPLNKWIPGRPVVYAGDQRLYNFLNYLHAISAQFECSALQEKFAAKLFREHRDHISSQGRSYRFICLALLIVAGRQMKLHQSIIPFLKNEYRNTRRQVLKLIRELNPKPTKISPVLIMSKINEILSILGIETVTKNDVQIALNHSYSNKFLSMWVVAYTLARRMNNGRYSFKQMGYRQDEIARAFNVPAYTFRDYYKKARDFLRDHP